MDKNIMDGLEMVFYAAPMCQAYLDAIHQVTITQKSRFGIGRP